MSVVWLFPGEMWTNGFTPEKVPETDECSDFTRVQFGKPMCLLGLPTVRGWRVTCRSTDDSICSTPSRRWLTKLPFLGLPVQHVGSSLIGLWGVSSAQELLQLGEASQILPRKVPGASQCCHFQNLSNIAGSFLCLAWSCWTGFFPSHRSLQPLTK